MSDSQLAVKTLASGATAQLRELVEVADYENGRRMHAELLRIAAKIAAKHGFKVVVVEKTVDVRVAVVG